MIFNYWGQNRGAKMVQTKRWVGGRNGNFGNTGGAACEMFEVREGEERFENEVERRLWREWLN